MTAVISDEDLLDLRGIGQRQDSYTFLLLDSARTVLGMLTPVADGSPSVQVDTSRQSFRTVSGFTLIDPPSDIDLTRDRVQPVLTLPNGSSFPLGVLMFGEDSRRIYDRGQVWTPQLFDENFLLDQSLGRTWSLPKDGSVLGFFTDLATTVLDPLGIPHDYDVPDMPSAQAVVKKAGTSRLTAMNESAAALGCFPPYFDNDGVHRLRLAPKVVTVPDHSYGLGTRIFDDTTTLTSSLYKAPNRYIVIGKDLAGGPVRGVYDLPPSAPNSYGMTGRVVTAPVHSIPSITTNELARTAAYVDALTDQTSYRAAEFAAAADPRHGLFESVALFDDLYMETGWTLNMTAGADHSHSLTGVFV